MKKSILITGSTDGIGKLAATQFAKEGHRVYLHGRNPEKLATVVSEIQALTHNETVKGFVADFSDFKSVRSMAQQIKEELSELDILINNAGVFMSPASQTKDGLDLRIVVNYLAQYVLTEELIPLLKKGSEARMINLSSAAQSSVSYDALAGKKRLNVQESYAQSKLALTMWSFFLAKSLPDIAVIAVNPGSLLNTRMAKEAYGQHWAPADKGADILHDLAVSEQYMGVTGKYFDNDRGGFGQAHPDAYDEAKIELLINATKHIISEY